MTVGICGLGLIGGSAAKAYKQNAPDTRVLGFDKNPTSQSYALLCGMIDGTLDTTTLPACDLVLVALYPDAAVEYMKQIAPVLKKDCVLIDLCGVKEQVCKVGFALAEQYGFCFVGGHPMAGTHNSGIKYTRANLFSGAPMVIVPPTYEDIALLDHIKHLLSPMGFGSITVSTAKEHDRMIAFLSQLTHCIAVALMTCNEAEGLEKYTGDSFRDLTRIAKINDAMWSELFLLNKDALLKEMDAFINEFEKMKRMLLSSDREGLRELMRRSTQRRSLFDKPSK